VVAVTDKRWSDFLSARSHRTEANFWTPSSVGFRALTTGEPMLFKTHAPHNRLVGGGFLSGFVTLPRTAKLRPEREALTWHMDTVQVGLIEGH